jgi:hypothetical protein
MPFLCKKVHMHVNDNDPTMVQVQATAWRDMALL